MACKMCVISLIRWSAALLSRNALESFRARRGQDCPRFFGVRTFEELVCLEVILLEWLAGVHGCLGACLASTATRPACQLRIILRPVPRANSDRWAWDLSVAPTS